MLYKLYFYICNPSSRTKNEKSEPETSSPYSKKASAEMAEASKDRQL